VNRVAFSVRAKMFIREDGRVLTQNLNVSSVKIVIIIRFSGAFNRIMKQPKTF